METGNLTVDAQTAFSRARWQRRRARVKSWVLGRSGEANGLAVLNDADTAMRPVQRGNVGLRAIPLCSIVGTAEPSKAGAFDSDFRPPSSSRRRWEGLWVASRRGAPLPPISVYRVGQQHFVGDGHHRVSVARSLEMAAIDAEVIVLG